MCAVNRPIVFSLGSMSSFVGNRRFSFGKFFSPGHNLIECEVKVLQLDSLDTYCGIMFSWLAPL